MVNIYIRDEKAKIVKGGDLHLLTALDCSKVAWIDMIAPNETERRSVEEYLGITLQTSQRAEEIESSSRYYEGENAQYANTTFVSASAEGVLSPEQVSFALSEAGALVSVRQTALRAFNDTIRRLYVNPRQYPTCFHIIVSILESRIDIDADQLEAIAKEVASLHKISASNSSKYLDKNLLLTINRLQENTMTMRESVVDKQRIVSSFLRSDHFPSDTRPKLSVMIKDIGSLISYADFTFERMEYLQDTIRGLIALDQNKVIKIFTVATLIFMPPTLISGIYGMNFDVMPELKWTFGYPFALGLMIMSAIITLLVFKLRKLL
jgi:magnesium transporter